MLVTQSCLTLCDPMDCSPPGSSAHGILQARILEWVAIPLSRGSSWPRNWTQVSHIVGKFFTVWATGRNHILIRMLNRFSHVWLFATLWTVAHQAPQSMGFSRQYWSGCHFLLHGNFSTQGSNLRLLLLLHWQAGSLTLKPPGKFYVLLYIILNK